MPLKINRKPVETTSGNTLTQDSKEGQDGCNEILLRLGNKWILGEVEKAPTIEWYFAVKTSFGSRILASRPSIRWPIEWSRQPNNF